MPLNSLIECAQAFSGRDTFEQEHILGAISKFVFCQQPSAKFCTNLERHFVKDKDFAFFKKTFIASEEARQ